MRDESDIPAQLVRGEKNYYSGSYVQVLVNQHNAEIQRQSNTIATLKDQIRTLERELRLLEG